MAGAPTTVTGTPHPVRRALALLLVRLLLVAVVTVLTWWIVSGAAAGDAPFPPSPTVAALSLIPVNVVCLLLTARMVRGDGQRLRDFVAYRKGDWGREVAWGFLWVVVLFVPFVAAVVTTMWLLHGRDVFVAFETVFYDPDAPTIASPGLALALGVVVVLTFAPLNAPAEEMVFRGYAQSRLAVGWSNATAVAVPSVAFGVQHAFFAPTTDAILVYVVAFTVWGVGSALIVRHQRRLLPITTAHFLVNLMTSSPAVVFPVLTLAGVV